MRQIEIKANFIVFDAIDQLPEQDRALMSQAIEIRDKAYAPYSKFKVGASILLENGTVVLGNNQENACYPSGLCAERTAIFAAGANFPDIKILKIAISAKSSSYLLKNPTPPCGSCRQAIAEYEYKQNQFIEIFFMGETGDIIKSNSLQELLPLGFNSSFL